MTSQLIESVNTLAKHHDKVIHTSEGIEIHQRAGLLEQLRDAVFGGMEKTGGSGTKAKLPMSDAAVDLYDLIDRQISEAWASVNGRPPSVERPEQLVTEWAAVTREDVIVVVTHTEQYERWDEAKGRNVPYVIRAREEFSPQNLVGHWIALIEDFLNPERTAGIKAPCIQCGASKVARRKDGESVTTDAMVFRRDRDTGRTLDARCLNCGAMWVPSQFEFLAASIGINIQRALADVEREMTKPTR